jgi:hypothetical protein
MSSEAGPYGEEDQSIKPGVNALPVDLRVEVRAALLKAGKPVE